MSTPEKEAFNPAELMLLYAEIARKSGEIVARAMQKAPTDPRKARKSVAWNRAVSLGLKVDPTGSP